MNLRKWQIARLRDGLWFLFSGCCFLNRMVLLRRCEKPMINEICKNVSIFRAPLAGGIRSLVHVGFRKLNVILLEETAFALDLYEISPMEDICPIEKHFAANVAATLESAISEDDVLGVGDYEGAAAGWGALKAVADAVRGQKAIVKETRGLLSMNQPQVFDCP